MYLEAGAKQPPPDDEDGPGQSSGMMNSGKPQRGPDRGGAGRRSRYRQRKQIVEPVFGQIKQAKGFRQFLVRELNKVRGEWAMICTVHNLLKLAKATG